MKAQKMHRHGEVLMLEVTSIPQDAKLVETVSSYIVGHSESGHHHVLTATNPFKVFELDGEIYLDIPKQAKLTHQKAGTETHGTQQIKPAIYKRIIKKSYSYAERAMRRVID